MKDALGNTLEAGQLVLWNNMIAKVTSVDGGGVVDIRRDAKTDAIVTLEVKLQNPQPGFCIRVVDPAADKLIESVMSAP